jgi:hypothetical protein
MASSNVSAVYISVIEDVVANVREDFITYGVGDAVLNELQAVSSPTPNPLELPLDFRDFDPIRPENPSYGK